MKDCRAIVALCLCRFGVLRQGVYGNVPCRNQTLLLGRVASRCGGGGCLDSVVQLSGVLLERCLKSGVRHDGLADSGGWRGELSNTHECPPQIHFIGGADLSCHYMAFLRYVRAFAAFTVVNCLASRRQIEARGTEVSALPMPAPHRNAV